MIRHKCFECGFESLGYCSARRDSEDAMLPIVDDRNGCEMFIRTPTDQEIEEIEEMEEVMDGKNN